jgi:geranylgeranyl diphosphate synthase type I
MIGTAPAVLERARLVVEPVLREAVGRLTPDLLAPLHYHLGWADADGRPVAGGGGKGVRPALAILSAEAAGADGEVGVPGAVAVELVHNYSLLHDDVMDGDRERRHRPTVWALFGVGQAIIAGDALVTLAVDVLLEQESAAASRAARDLVRATDAMIAGQAADLAYERRRDVSVQECSAMERGKTGALLGCAASIGARLAGGDPALVEGLERYGVELGLAFQAVDDVLGIWGSPEVTGKPAWSDLRQRKKALPLLHALAHEDADGELHALVAGPGRPDGVVDDRPLGDAEVARAALLVEAHGGRARTEEAADAHLGAALRTLDDLDVAPAARAELEQLARFVVDRSY